MKSGMPCKFFIYNGYDHIFYLYYTWHVDMLDRRDSQIFKDEVVDDLVRLCDVSLEVLEKEYLGIVLNSELRTLDIEKHKCICLFKYSGGVTSLKESLTKKWALLHCKDNLTRIRVLAQLILRGDYEIWNV